MLDVIIIGMGCAGMSAGVYAKRSNLNVLLLDSSSPGGILNKVSKIENYLGFKSISGADLAYNMFEHINNEKVEYKIAKVLNVEKNNNEFIVSTTRGEFKSKSIVFASGRKLKKSGILNEEDFIGKGISYCATCDGAFYKDKDVIVIGNDKVAAEEAIYLSGLSSVTFISDKDINKEEKKLLKDNNIKLINNKKVVRFNGKDVLESILLDDDTVINAQGAFVYSGYNADASFINSLNITDDKGYIIVDKNMKTKVDNVYACGDAIKKDLYQVSTAVAEGAIAINSLVKSLKEEKRYKVITLCGSTRFKDEFYKVQKELTLKGNIVISVGLFGHSGDSEVWENMDEGTLTKTKEMLDDMHKRKIDMADEIYVINVGGYIGDSTKSEIKYAEALGKKVNYLEE